uniref:Jupiter microtubule associated homolog 1a n=1 Tax=Esox lucius TaxID=8010 RepID=A0AAY5L932_ESOLU
MTTTTIYSGMEAGAKSSSRVLCPPGGASNISFGNDEEKPPCRKNKMASNIFAEPDDPHAHRRNNPPGGKPTGVLCGEPSAPLRRCVAQSSGNHEDSNSGVCACVRVKYSNPWMETMTWGMLLTLRRPCLPRSKGTKHPSHQEVLPRPLPGCPQAAGTPQGGNPASSWVEALFSELRRSFFVFIKERSPLISVQELSPSSSCLPSPTPLF